MESSKAPAWPWLGSYPAREKGLGRGYALDRGDALSLFRRAVATSPGADAIRYFDAAISYERLDMLSDAFCGYLKRTGVHPGDRVALFLQNVPQFVICLVGTWKAGAICVSINPMNRGRELRQLLADSGARVLVTHASLYVDVAREVLRDFPAVSVLTTRLRDLQTRNDPRVFASEEPSAGDVPDLLEAIGDAVGAGGMEMADPSGAALIVYTSGTTGVPKGAVISHGALAFEGQLWKDWIGLREGGPILAIAPLFHITGLGGHIAAAFATAAPLILTMRFHPDVVSEAVQEHRAEFSVGAITAYIAMMNSPGVSPLHWRTMRHVYSGGAPVPAAVAARFREQFGLQVHNAFGLTETTSLAVAVPAGCASPVDRNGALSVGLPVFGTQAYVADEAGRPLGPGELGEVMLRGPQLMSGYWNRPDETRDAMLDGYLRTGDIGSMDGGGWLFLVDRKKDVIVASGYKVWPKEVEDVLYGHPAVAEAAVIGVADAYRGETVKAVLSLKPGQFVGEEELVALCRQNLAAYKVPRLFEFRPELPKTASGKILRRELRGVQVGGGIS